MPVVSVRHLLEAGVHFGHQTRRWNPKMQPYIFTERSGIYIFDLQRTLRELDAACAFSRQVASRGGHVLFVGTKKQAQESIRAEAQRSGNPYVNQRWLGGMLTNFVTMRARVDRLVRLESMIADGTMASLPKKEQILLNKEREKLERNLSGVRDMKEVPAAMFVVDTKREAIAVAEARRLGIPTIGVVDTNADPDEVDFVIPANDDAIRSVSLLCRAIADAAIAGRAAAGLPDVASASVAPDEASSQIAETTEPGSARADLKVVSEQSRPEVALGDDSVD